MESFGKTKYEEYMMEQNQDYKVEAMGGPIFTADSTRRNWLKKHGKAKYIDFDDAERKELRKYFTSLDADGSGNIGVEELEDPLVALGLVSGREEVQKLIEEVDKDKSNQIEFTEFLSLMSNIKNKNDQKESLLYNFFTGMINGKLMDSMDPNLPFLLNVSQFRRKKILDAIMSEDKTKREDGQKILQAFKKQLLFKKQQDKIAKGENPNEISLDQPPLGDTGLLGSKNKIFKPSDFPMSQSKLLMKPKSIPIQTLKNFKH